jgi:hypothetical protein
MIKSSQIKMSVDKQLHINRFQLPQDIQEQIKSWCFYDPITGNARIQKREVLKNIKNAITVEKEGNLLSWMTEIDFKRRFWFSIGETEGWHYQQWICRQCNFCEKCGNYTDIWSEDQYETTSINAWCYCDMPHLIDFEDE